MAVPLAAEGPVGAPGQEGPTLEPLPSPPPAELAESIRALLAPSGFRIELDGGSSGELWIRSELEMAESPNPGLGVELGRLRAGALVGAVRFLEPWRDYRKTTVAAGLYTLRYAVQPADGDHMGVSEYRDFLLLVPAAADRDGGRAFARDDLVEASSGASGVVHPAVLALFPIWDELSASPQLLRNEIDQWTLAIEVGDVVLGVVIEGHGEI